MAPSENQVEPEPDDSQFVPRIEGDYLIGRGAADMKTVAATYLVWMKDVRRGGGPFPGIQLLLVGNEGTGLSADARDAADARLRIPMTAGADSLNLATATGIALYVAMTARRG